MNLIPEHSLVQCQQLIESHPCSYVEQANKRTQRQKVQVWPAFKFLFHKSETERERESSLHSFVSVQITQIIGEINLTLETKTNSFYLCSIQLNRVSCLLSIEVDKARKQIPQVLEFFFIDIGYNNRILKA